MLKGSGRTQGPPEQASVAESWAAASEAVLMKCFAEGEWFGKVSVLTDLTAEEVLSRVAEERAAGTMAPDEAADILFPFLFEGTVYERRRVYAALRELATPEAILQTALRAHRFRGYEGYLSEAASLLADFKAAAWPTIRKWARLGGECEVLVSVITTIEGIAEDERRDALMDIAQGGDENARRRVLESIHILPHRARREVLQVLRGPMDPSDPVQAEAAERLAEYEM
jgi:hypothetical protein